MSRRTFRATHALGFLVPLGAFVLAPCSRAQAVSATPDTARIGEAVGTLEVFPYADAKKPLRCTAFHIGDGRVVTAGHCLLGAMACNGARFVPNAEARKLFPRISRCTEVLAVESDALRPGSTGQDSAVLRVFPAPRARLDPAPVPEDGLDSALRGEGGNPDARYLTAEGAWRHPNPLPFAAGRDALAAIAALVGLAPHEELGLCAGALPVLADFFGRPRPVRLIETRCTLSGYDHGAPVLREDNAAVIGFVLGSFRTPTRSDLRTHFALLPQTHSQTTSPPVHVGWFAPEAFPYGLDGGLSFVARHFEGSGPIEISVAQGLLTDVIIEQASGISVRFSGAPSFTSVQPRVYERPLTVRVLTRPLATSVQAAIEIHPPSQ